MVSVVLSPERSYMTCTCTCACSPPLHTRGRNFAQIGKNSKPFICDGAQRPAHTLQMRWLLGLHTMRRLRRMQLAHEEAHLPLHGAASCQLQARWGPVLKLFGSSWRHKACTRRCLEHRRRRRRLRVRRRRYRQERRRRRLPQHAGVVYPRLRRRSHCAHQFGAACYVRSHRAHYHTRRRRRSHRRR